MTAREAITAAASSVEGVTVTPYWRQTTTPLSGFLTRQRTEPDGSGIGRLDTWQIVLPLASDIPSAEQLWEQIGADLLDALEPELYVTSVDFLDLQYDSASLPGAVITGTREG